MKSSPYKMMPKSPAMKALIGNQKNLPDALKQKILNSKATTETMDDGDWEEIDSQ